jgi:RNA polymerase sigma-70 factor (ECF subfamily)
VTPSTESDLLSRLRAGDVHAYETIFRRYHARLCAFAFGHLRNRADADEIVQELFIALWQKRGQIQVASSLRAYLFAAVRNRVLNRSARARLEQRWLEEATAEDIDVPDAAEPIDEVLNAAEIRARVETAIAALPPGCRRVLELRWYEQLSYAEIADVLGISIKGVENQLARARKTLRAAIAGLID